MRRGSQGLKELPAVLWQQAVERSGIYSEPIGLELPDEMRKVEHRTVDAVLIVPGSPPRVLEVAEKHHFNAYRAALRR
ncbi:hypothetical protein [Microvirga roseola]|uniref:hypothetical protein n=1 Tax=Microvirga roseola TaxID=2883126 RepID=UPI001E31C225|nr:hypothetical protein [Microvirga roseola]